ncbi:MAG: family 10 glycosylhydrolase [Leptotrichiaceae bacterium]|nr:family 10 glycosylhydrolase [Leptotrichiaceae bacterium]
MVVLVKKIILLMAILASALVLNAKSKISSNEEREILNIINSYNNDKSKLESTRTGTFNQRTNELRGVWVASVINIDWPSKKGLSVESQKREYIQILENVKKWNMNAVFVQVKPVGDAFYPSKYAPWSEYLTGTQGINPGYDPLKFMVDEAHKRGIEFHAWFNPYRLTMNGGIEKLSSNNIGRKKPEWTVMYGGKLYLNPGIPEVNDYVVDSVMEVVKNYDIDGVHMDDYFYPYKVKGQEYPDSTQYKKYGRNFSSIGDWRRNNINMLVQKLNKSIKNEKSDVSFGISPFGVWRNASTDPIKGSNTRAGIQNYDDLYADILKWMENSWLDYVAPQIYWNQGFEVAEYNTLVNWWSNNAKKTKTDLYIGQAAYKVKDWTNSNELTNQINYNRRFSEVKGSIFFSYKSLRDNPKNIMASLLNGPYNK